MNLLGRGGRIFAYGAPVDMRKGFAGLESLILQDLGENPLSGDTFVFVSRRGRHIKCFLWDRTGFVIVTKRLEHGTFRLHGSGIKIELDDLRLRLLLDGLTVGGVAHGDRN